MNTEVNAASNEIWYEAYEWVERSLLKFKRQIVREFIKSKWGQQLKN
jgi:hypothetical protein